jgi:hypothetical protein
MLPDLTDQIGFDDVPLCPFCESFIVFGEDEPALAIAHGAYVVAHTHCVTQDDEYHEPEAE